MTNPPSTVTLTVHGIGTPVRPLDPGEDEVWVTVQQFEDVLDAVAGRTDVRITFDDANASDVEIALPQLSNAASPHSSSCPPACSANRAG